MFMNRAIQISLNASCLSRCHRMGDTRVPPNCATAVRLCAARAGPVRCTYDTRAFPVSARVAPLNVKTTLNVKTAKCEKPNNR